MARKGFRSKWRKWIHHCLECSHFSIMLYGSLKGFFLATRGLRQDPLSPCLFTLIADALSQILREGEKQHLIKGFQVGKEVISISHLQYEDVTLLFLDREKDHLSNLISMICCFELLSGIKMSWKKSSFLVISSNNQEYTDIKMLWIVKICNFPIKYLGAPLGGSPRNREFWIPVIERCKKNLATWKANYQSFGGRITLIKATLSNLPIYYLSTLKIPRG